MFARPAEKNPSALPWLAGSVAENVAGWIGALRATGAEAFARTGFPTPKWEGWQYINLRDLSPEKFSPTVSPVADIPAPLLEKSRRIVLRNGRYMPGLSAPPVGVEVLSLADAAEKIEDLDSYLASIGDLETSPFKALNTAHLGEGCVIRVAAGKDIAEPLEVLFWNEGAAAIYPRLVYWLGENAGLTVLERYEGTGAYFFNGYAEVVQQPAARLKFYRLMDDSDAAFHYSQTAVQQQKSAHFEGFALALGARTARQEFNFKLIDSGIYSSISGAYLLKGQQNHDFTILYDHFEPDGKSVQNFKGVVDDQARAVFQGKIHVRRSAQKTDGYQSHHALLLSRQAEASAKPELEIYADDVKCSHGATSGHLDPVALFYLRSRGIPEAEARALLIRSFINEVIEKVSDPAVRELFLQRASARLQAGNV